MKPADLQINKDMMHRVNGILLAVTVEVFLH